MSNAHFIIPYAPENEQPKVEYESTAFGRVKKVEGNVEAYRQAATEDTLPRSKRMQIMGLFTSAPRPLEERLIEEESRIGGTIFQKSDATLNQRFWYHSANWYFEHQTVDGLIDVARYQTTPVSIHKLVEGKECAFEEGEVKRFIAAVDAYETRVVDQLYLLESLEAKKSGYDLAA